MPPAPLPPPAESTAWVICKWTGALIASIWIAIPVAMRTLIAIMGLDFAAEFIVACLILHNWKKAEFVRALALKTLILILIAAAQKSTQSLGLGFDVGSVVATGFVIIELRSIVDACKRAGVTLPPGLTELLKPKNGKGSEEKESSG